MKRFGWVHDKKFLQLPVSLEDSRVTDQCKPRRLVLARIWEKPLRTSKKTAAGIGIASDSGKMSTTV